MSAASSPGSTTRVEIVDGATRTTLTLGTPGPRGLSYPEQLFDADLIDTPSLDATNDFLRAPAVDATDAANAAAALAEEKAGLAVSATAGAQAVVDASPTIMAARDTAVSAAGTATAAATSLSESVTDVTRMSVQIKGSIGGRSAGRWVPGIVDDVTWRSLLSFSANSGRAKLMGSHDLDFSDSATAGRLARPFGWAIKLPNDQVALGIDGATYQVSYLALTTAEATRLRALGGGSTYTAPDLAESKRIVGLGSAAYQTANSFSANTVTDTGVGTGGGTGRNAGGFAWSLKLSDNRALIGVDATLQISYIAVNPTEAARIIGVGGGLTTSGLLVANALRTNHLGDVGVATRGTGRLAGGFAWSIKLANGQALLGVDPVTTQISHLALSPAEATRLVRLAGGALGYSPPGQLRDGRTLIDPVQGTTYLFGKVNSRDGFTIVVKQANASTYSTAVPDDPRKLVIFATYGQSNAGWGGTLANANYPRKIIGPLYPYSVFSMAKGGQPWPATSADIVDDGLENDFYPMADAGGNSITTGIPQSQHTMSMFGIEAAYRARGETGPGIVGHLDWYGGQPLTTFIKGTQLYTNLIQHAGLMAKLGGTIYGRQPSYPAISFIQGESGPYDGSWLTLATQMVSDIRTDVLAAIAPYGGTAAPVVLFSQTNANDNQTTLTSVQLEQLQICRNLPTTTAMAGPSYFAPIPDNIHALPEGRAMEGEVIGEAVCTIAKGGTWTPLWSTIMSGENGGYRVNRSGNTITIQYTRFPTGLEFDPGGAVSNTGGWEPGPNDGWVKPVSDPYYGFYYSDDAGNHITNVALATDAGGYFTKVVITLSGNPDGVSNRFLCYARHVFDSGSADGWSSVRGSLRSCLRKSRLRDEGLNIPQFIYAYACCEEWKTGDTGANL
ncbi:hypothetical protein [Sphingomonas sp. MMS24-J13]|uniref:hypothetical protein n=1 Tax=Sphingomonas sp. MMS24-J13 TaxID=3238686 RepID=UPI00384CEC73